MKFRLELRFVYFQTSGSTINSYLDGLVVNRIIVQLCYGYLWVALGSEGLKLILLSIKDNCFYENSYTLGGPWPPGPPLNPRLSPIKKFKAAGAWLPFRYFSTFL